MSVITIETTITPKYLRSKTKDEIIDHVMRLLRENDDLRAAIEAQALELKEAREVARELANMAIHERSRADGYTCGYCSSWHKLKRHISHMEDCPVLKVQGWPE